MSGKQRSASFLNHPNIVTIYEVGSADGESYVYAYVRFIDERYLVDGLR